MRAIITNQGNIWRKLQDESSVKIFGASGSVVSHDNVYPARFEKMWKTGYGVQCEVTEEQYKEFLDLTKAQNKKDYFKSLHQFITTNQREMKQPEVKEEAKPETKPEENKEQEFVIEVTAFDIKDEIKKATKEFVAENCGNTFEKELDKVVEKAVQKLTPNYIKIGEREQIKVEGRTHKEFENCAFLAQHQRQIFIAGPAGSGKTTLGEQIAKAFKLDFAFISCSVGMSEAHLLGRMLFDGTYIASDFVNTYEKGGVFLMDEVDAADANTLLTINSALANGMIAVPNRKEQPHARRHKDFILIASANTWGSGSYEYHGRNHLDAAFLDRFAMSRVFVDYDKQIEKEFCSEALELAKVLWEIRKNCEKNKVRKIVSTRAFKEGAIQMKAGKTLKQVIERFTVGWTEEEKAKVVPADFAKITEEQVEEVAF